MRNVILGAVAGLIVGSAGALGYSHFLGDGGQLASLQAQLDDANAKLAKSQSDQKFLKEQYNSETEQLNQVLASKSQQSATSSTDTTTAAAPASTPLSIGGVQITPDMIRGFMMMMSRGGGPGGMRSPEQRMFLLQSRLKLDPEQAKAIRAAMDADQQARRDLFRQSRQSGQPVDPAALAAINSLDRTMASVLTPTQQVQYQQVQADEKAARAEINATQQVDNLMPLLQLTDDQKEKAMTALYQQQLSASDPAAAGNSPAGFMNGLAQQGQAAQSAFKSVLTPDQFAVYQQNDQVQQEAMANFGNGGNARRSNGGNGTGANASGPSASSPAATTATASGTTAASGSASTPTGTTTATGTTIPTDTTTPAATSTTGTSTAPATNAPTATPPSGN